MQSFGPTVFRNWPLLAALAAAVMLAIAHAFQTFGGLAPCELCLKQREGYWVALALGLVGFLLIRVVRGSRVRTLVGLVLAVAFLYEAGLAAFHAGVEWKLWQGPQECTGGARASAAAISGLLGGARIVGPRCDVAAWRFLGLSMAGWNVGLALGLAGLSLFAAFGKEPDRGQDL
jgi:disulfide bond formation protein DsbB